MRTFEYKVLSKTHKGWLGIRWITSQWYDENDQPLNGLLKDVLPPLGAQGWEVCGVGSGADERGLECVGGEEVGEEVLVVLMGLLAAATAVLALFLLDTVFELCSF